MAQHGHGAGDETRPLREQPVQEIQNAPDGAVVVRLAGELDLYNAHVVREAVLDCVEDAPARLVVDLGEVTFVDSTALGVLVEARTRLRDRRSLMLAAPRPEVRRALEVSGLDRHFALHETVSDALAATL